MLYFHPFLGISVCLAESWIIKDKHIFNVCVALLGLLLVVLGTLWSGTGLDKTPWAEGEKAVLEEGREGLIRALSKLRAPRAAACCQRGGPRKLRNYAAPVRSWNWRMNEPTAQQGREALSPLHKSHSSLRGGTVTIQDQSV